MRMSVKVKLPLIIFIAFIINVSALLIYYRFYAYNGLQKDFQAYIDGTIKIRDYILTEIEEHYPDKSKIESFIMDVSNKSEIKVLLKDANQKEFFSVDNRGAQAFGYTYTTVDHIKIKDETVCIVELGYSHFPLKRVLNTTNTIEFEVLIMFIYVVLLAVYLHFYIVKPLGVLQKTFGMVTGRNNMTPKRFKRKDEIGGLYKGFEDMVKRLELSQSQQIEMVSSISHDLKTPLTSVMGYVERLMSSTTLPEEKRQGYYRIIYKKSQDIEKLIEDFSDYTKNEEDCKKLNKEEISVKTFLDSISQEYTMELQAYNAEFKSDCLIKDDVLIFADIKKLRRVFANLISNSIKYGHPPIIVKVSCRLMNDEVVFIVEDNGRGVPEEELSNIFNKFYRLDKSRSPKKGERGLGLSICKSIIESHIGRIWADNIEQGGLRVSFTLPKSLKSLGRFV